MNEKEKFEIIKEIAECNKDSCKDCNIVCSYYSAITSFCEKVLPEGSVVLTSEQYSNYLILQTNHEFIREKAKELQADNERLYKNLGKFKESVRKETAKEFAEKMKTIDFDVDFTIKQSSFEDVEKVINSMFKYLMDYIDELAKQYGVEE